MRVLLLFVALLLSSLVAPAQTLPAARPADSLALPLVAAPPDSATALRRMFAAKRSNRTLVLLGTVLASGFTLGLNGLFGSDKQSPLSQAAGQTQVVALTAVVGVGELVYYHQYSPKKEQLAQLALAQHKLSPELKHHLKARYFQPSKLIPAQAGPAPFTALLVKLPPPTPLSAAAPTVVDTAAALHRLFAQRRHNGHVTLTTGAVILGVSGIALAIANGNNDFYSGIAGILGAVVSIPVLISGTVRTIAHSKGREQRVLQTWQQHRLPKRWVRRALIPEYTQPQK